MSEDEAFIRAIVDNPGDDTPRLVYADWLDDRDDPRGPFLRAEHAWAKPWREGSPPEDSSELRDLAIGLGATWVARVSRPPLGVCCDHIRFADCGPRLTEEDFEEVRRWRRVRMPHDYVAFLLNYNGGHPHLPGFRLYHWGAPGADISRFFALQPNGGLRERGTLHCEVNRYWNDLLPPFLEDKPVDVKDDDVTWYHDFIPVAEAVPASETLMLGVYGEYRGRIQVINWDWTPGSYSDQESVELGNSVAGLLARIVPDAG